MDTNQKNDYVPFNKNKEWTDEDREKCRKLIIEKKLGKDNEIAQELGRTEKSIPFRRCIVMYELHLEGHSKEEIKEMIGITMDAEYDVLCNKGKQLIDEDNLRKKNKADKEQGKQPNQNNKNKKMTVKGKKDNNKNKVNEAITQNNNADSKITINTKSLIEEIKELREGLNVLKEANYDQEKIASIQENLKKKLDLFVEATVPSKKEVSEKNTTTKNIEQIQNNIVATEKKETNMKSTDAVKTNNLVNYKRFMDRKLNTTS